MTAKLHWLWALLLLPTWAEAAVVVTYRGDAPNTFTFDPPFITDTDFDVNADGVSDYRFAGDFLVAGVQPYGANRVISLLSVPPDLGGDVTPVLLGSIIGADTTSLAGDWHNPMDGRGAWFGLNFGPNAMQYADAYIGVEFMAADGIHYGWIQYTGYSHPVNGLPAMPVPGGVMNSWAWETQPGVPIIAGAIPEPSTALLVGAGSVLLWQRNANTRKQNKALQATPRGRLVSTLHFIRRFLGFGSARPRP